MARRLLLNPTPLLRSAPPFYDCLLSKAIMAWPCSQCTFLNPPSQKSTCQICLSPSTNPSPTPPSSSGWPCGSCTFLNNVDNSTCEICGTRSTPLISGRAIVHELVSGDELDSSIGSIFLPLQRCKRINESPEFADDSAKTLETPKVPESKAFNEFLGKLHAEKRLRMTPSSSGITEPCSDMNTLKILTYNVWFREDLEMHRRMEALGDLIQQHSPHFICFQEVTPNIYGVFQLSSWWKMYKCSVSEDKATMRPYFCMQLSRLPVKAFNQKPFENSIMGRELCTTKVDLGNGKELVVASSHLESPCPAPPSWNQMFSKERVDQAKESLKCLEVSSSENIIYGGDMNWDDKSDGLFPLSDGWVDAWTELRPEENGWTYDTKSNTMLSSNRSLQKRLDRFVCKLKDFKLSGIEMIGTGAIPGLTYCKEKKVRKELKKLVLPVFPSDHYGLILEICRL